MVRAAFLSFLFLSAIVPAAPEDAVFIDEISAVGGSGLLYLDEDEELHDWVELRNPTESPVDLSGWFLSDDLSDPMKWELPPTLLAPQGFLVVFCSGKDRKSATDEHLHTNFRLDGEGETVLLSDPSSDVVSQVEYLPQHSGYSYGFVESDGSYRFMNPSPEVENDLSRTFSEFLSDTIHFSVPRGHFNAPFEVSLTSDHPASEIRFTTDGGPPGWDRGTTYAQPINISETTCLRAVALQPGLGPSEVETHSYFFNLTDVEKGLPTLSLVTDEGNVFGADGIIGTPTMDNREKRGRAWERPVSVEYLEPLGEGEFQIDGGIRVHGGLSRSLGKNSFRLYFRNEYGEDRLEYPLMPESEVTSFKRIVLRGGAQDTNPFINDEMSRRMFGDTGQVTTHGTFVQLFLNGEHRGYYNSVERQDRYFFRSWFGGESDWDIIKNNLEGINEGDGVAWNEMYEFIATHDISQPIHYQELSRRLDITNFADYLLSNIFASPDDWPQNNWTAAREIDPPGKFRFFVWDAERSYGRGFPPTHDTIAILLENQGHALGLLYEALASNSEFRKLVGARYRKHFFENGGLTEANAMARYLTLRQTMLPALPNFFGSLYRGWIPGRRYNLEKILDRAGLFDPVALPVNQGRGRGTLAPADLLLSPESADLNRDAHIDEKDLLAFKEENRRNLNPEFRRRSIRNSSWIRDDYAVGAGIKGLLAEDFDGDGDRDLVTIDSYFGRILVFENRGDGTFEEPRESLIELGGTAIASEDFNGDGLLDLALSTDFMLQKNVIVLKNRGDLQFSEEFTTPFHQDPESRHLHPRSLYLRDLDGDEDLDLIVQNESSIVVDGQPIGNFISVLENRGMGDFVSSASIKAGSAILTSPQGMVVEDLDGDGDVDLVALSGRKSFLYFRNSGGGGFDPPLEIPAPNFANLVSGAGADIDGRNGIDLAFGDGMSGSRVSFFYNDGSGGFAEGPFLTATEPTDLLLADLNRDQSPDLLFLKSNAFLSPPPSIPLFLNDGAGAFTPVSELVTCDPVAFPRWKVVADLDNDGDNDLAMVEEYQGTLTLFLNQLIPAPPSADVNADGAVDWLDTLEIGKNWKTSTGVSK